MNASESRELIRVFLGEETAAAWTPEEPHALLGLLPGTHPREAIVSSLQRRLAFVALHPMRDTPQAAQVRHLMQTAAADLMTLAAGKPLGMRAEAAAPPPPPAVVRPAPPKMPSQTLPQVDKPSAPVTTSPARSAEPYLVAPVEARPTAPPPPPSSPPPLPVIETAAGPGPALRPNAVDPRLVANQSGNAVPAAAPTLPPAQDAAMASLRREAAFVLAQGSHIDSQTLLYLVNLAQAHGLPPEAALAVVTSLTGAIGVPSSAAGPGGQVPAPNQAPSVGPVPPAGVATTPQATRTREPADSPPTVYTGNPDSGDAMLKRVLIIGSVVAVLALGAIGVLVIVLARGSGGSGAGSGSSGVPTAPSAAAPGSSPAMTTAASGISGSGTTETPAEPLVPAPRTPQPAATPAAPAAPLTDGRVILRDLRRVSDMVGENPAGALALFENAVAAAKASWVRHDHAERIAAVDALTDAVHRLSSDESLGLRAVAAIATHSVSAAGAPVTSADVWATAWSGGVLLRLTRERELPTAVAQAVSDGIDRVFGADRPIGASGFVAGSAATLRLMPLRMLQTKTPTNAVTAFALWEEAVHAMFGPTGAPATADPEGKAGPIENAAETVVLDALGQVMTQGPEPTDNRAVFEVISSMVARQRWRADDGSRQRLIDWFNDPRVSAADLSVLTASLVSKSSAEGVDLSMVLSANASAEHRTAMRDQYARAWSLDGVTPAAARSGDLARRATEALQKADEAKGAGAELAAAAQLAQTNRLALLTWRGEPLPPELTPAPGTGPSAYVTSVVVNFSPGLGASGGESSGWALRYLADKSTILRMERLKELDSGNVTPGTVDAEVLAEAAIGREAPDEIRALARKVCMRFANDAAMINGLLEAFPRAPRDEKLIRFIEDITARVLGPVSWERFRVEGRRALVERLLELMAIGGSPADADKQALRLAEAYQSMAGVESAGGLSEEQAGEAAVAAAGVLYRNLRVAAERYLPNQAAPMRLDVIDRQHEARLTAALGPIQRFAASQVSIAELVAFIVTGQHPAKAHLAAELLTTMQEQRRRATHVFSQIMATERTITQLWLLREGDAQ